jgi:DNA primase large subunit
MTARLLPRLDEDARLVPILNNLSQGFIAGSSSDWMNENGEANGEELRAEMIDDLSKKHFPMCMKTLHDRLQRDNHLKHFGRLQYGLFLKASPYLIFLEFRSRFHCPGSRTVSRRSGRLLEKVIQ